MTNRQRKLYGFIEQMFNSHTKKLKKRKRYVKYYKYTSITVFFYIVQIYEKIISY